MLAQSLAALFARDLAALRREIAAYPAESDLWRVAPGIENSAGTLALHVAGNLQHFLGGILGGTGYVRDRAGEFGRRDVPRAELLAEVDRAAAAVREALAGLTPETLVGAYPLAVGGVRVATGDFLTHLATHLAYHLGQVDYHRRLVTGDLSTIGAMAIPELATATSDG